MLKDQTMLKQMHLAEKKELQKNNKISGALLKLKKDGKI